MTAAVQSALNGEKLKNGQPVVLRAVTSSDVIIIDGGAAGRMRAIAAGKRGRRVVVFEGSNRIGKKILMLVAVEAVSVLQPG